MPHRTSSPSRAPSVRGWCPGVHEPMASGDGWLVRARTGCRTITSSQWRALAAVARRFGNGTVELTSRGNVQVRGVGEPDVGEVASLLVAAGLVPPSRAGERARCVVASPLAGFGLGAPCPAPGALVREVEASLEGEALAGLPAKWWAVVDDGGAWPLSGLPCDVRVRAVAGSGWALDVAGQPLGVVDDPVGAVVEVARASASGGCRARDLDSGWWARRLDITPVRPPEPERAGWLGARAFPGGEVLVAAPFLGRCTADDLDLLADLAGEDALVLRPTTERSLAVRGRFPEAVGACRGALRRAGWIVEPADDRAALSACVGRRGCEASQIDTEAAARRLIAAGETGRTHISGCPKGCGAPAGVRHLVATGPGTIEAVS